MKAKAEAALGMRLPIGECQTTAPGPAGNQPAIDVEMIADGFDVGDQCRGRVALNARKWRGLARTTLVERDDAKFRQIKTFDLSAGYAGSGAAMKQDDRDPCVGSVILDIQNMAAPTSNSKILFLLSPSVIIEDQSQKAETCAILLNL